MPEKTPFLVRTGCEYSVIVEAEDEKEAMKKASTIPYSEWDQAWSPYEAEEHDPGEPVIGPGGVGRTDMPAGMRGED